MVSQTNPNWKIFYQWSTSNIYLIPNVETNNDRFILTIWIINKFRPRIKIKNTVWNYFLSLLSRTNLENHQWWNYVHFIVWNKTYIIKKFVETRIGGFTRINSFSMRHRLISRTDKIKFFRKLEEAKTCIRQIFDQQIPFNNSIDTYI